MMSISLSLRMMNNLAHDEANQGRTLIFAEIRFIYVEPGGATASGLLLHRLFLEFSSYLAVNCFRPSGSLGDLLMKLRIKTNLALCFVAASFCLAFGADEQKPSVAMTTTANQAPSPQTKSAPQAERQDSPVEKVEKIEAVGKELQWDSPDFPRIDRVVNIQTASTTRRHAFLFTIDHRAWQTFTDHPMGDLMGFDVGAMKIGLGLRFGLFDRFDVGLLRLNGTLADYNIDTYDFDGKYHLLRQATHHVDVAVRGGVTWFNVAGLPDRSAFFTQLLVNRELSGRVRIGSGVLYHSDSYNDTKLSSDPKHSAAIPATVEVRVLPWLALNGEVAATVSGYGSDFPAFSASAKMLTRRHTFSLVFSNTQYLGPGGIATGSARGAGGLIFGFTIVRELPL